MANDEPSSSTAQKRWLFAERDIERPVLGQLSQGSFFPGAISGDYSDCPHRGLVITARCDVAHDKAPIFSYLPTVRLTDWMDRDGTAILAQRILSDTRDRLAQRLEPHGLSTTILDTMPAGELLASLLDRPEHAPLRAQRDELLRIGSTLDAASARLNTPPGSGDSKAYLHEHPKIVDRILRELTSHRLTGYYFLPRVSVEGPPVGHVVLLREVHHLPRKLAAAMARGLTLEKYRELCEASPSMLGKLNFRELTMLHPIGVLASPLLEHLMQQFGLLFGRIGVRDVPDEYRDELRADLGIVRKETR